MEKLKRSDQRESYCYASVDQWEITRLLSEEIAGSSPAGGTEAESNMMAWFNYNYEVMSRRLFESCGLPKRVLEGSTNENMAWSSRHALQEMRRRS